LVIIWAAKFKNAFCGERFDLAFGEKRFLRIKIKLKIKIIFYIKMILN
jgi:hypothetical protein